MRRALLSTCLLLASLGALATAATVIALLPQEKAEQRAQALVREAQQLGARGQRKASLAKVQEALKLAPDNPSAHREMGLHLMARGKVTEGLAELRRVAEAAPYDPGAAWELAFGYIAAQQPAEAEKWFLEVTRMERGNGAAYAMIANCRAQHGDLQGALKWAERGVKASPRTPLTQFTLGLTRWYTQDLEGARQSLEETLRLRPADAKALLALAAVTGKMHRSDLAAGYLERALRLVPDDPVTWVALGAARLNLHQPREAEQAFSRALALAPDNKMARAGLEKARQAQAPAAH